ncbi:hypothetical protein SFUMM280S_03622 [Streptomyces fumanus]
MHRAIRPCSQSPVSATAVTSPGRPCRSRASRYRTAVKESVNQAAPGVRITSFTKAPPVAYTCSVSPVRASTTRISPLSPPLTKSLPRRSMRSPTAA